MLPDTHCKSKCNQRKLKTSSGWAAFLPGLLIAILPKCPFCLLTYSSAITLCSGRTIYDHQSGWASWISISLVLITALAVLFNYKGRKTQYALLLVLLGGGLIVYSEFITGQPPVYYLGASLVLLACWLNGSLMHFYRKASFYFSIQKQSIE